MSIAEAPLDVRDTFFAHGDEADDALYPHLYHLSPRFFFQFLPRPAQPSPPEFLYLPMPKRDSEAAHQRMSLYGLMAQWNLAWESAQLRPQMFGHNLAEVAPNLRLREDANVFLLPDTSNKIDVLLPLYMLLPRNTLERFGLPPLRRPTWPSSFMLGEHDLFPQDVAQRVAAAFASLVWPFMVSGSPQSAFRRDDSLVMLSHNLDFWLPHVFSVVQDRLRGLDLVEFENKKEPQKLRRLRRDAPEGVWVDRCRQGGSVWLGRDDARQALVKVVEKADHDGQLSGIIDGIRSNRVEEDFSSRWSFAREDFERKLYDKRAKVKVRFVELERAECVVGPHSDITDNLLWQDFVALLDRKERQIVVCLTRGTTKLTEIATELGYANHSPVSKALVRIREKVRKLLM